MSVYGNIIIESKDKSSIKKNFRKKSGINFKIIELSDNTLFKLDCIKNDINLSNNLKYWISKGKLGEIAIDEKSKDIAGYICINKDGILAPFFIYEKYRGYGLSEIMLQDAINKFDANTLGVYTDNKVAINLYKKFGFEIVETQIIKDEKVYIMKRK